MRWGKPFCPFVQAVEQDLIACFVAVPTQEPSVVVIDPWSSRHVLRRELHDYDEWIAYAQTVSRNLAERGAREE